MKIVVAPDAMKGCLSARDVARAVADGLGAPCACVPLSDGGEGFVEVLSEARHSIGVRDLEGRPTRVSIGQRDNYRIIEVAQTIGLPLVSRGRPRVFHSAPIGELIAATRGPLVLGLGGSATVDGGLGMLRALGARFWSADGREITRPDELRALARVEGLPTRAGLTACCDTVVELASCARVFGPQKGARDSDIAVLEAGLARLAECCDPGARHRGAFTGAAGGLGFALSLMGAELVSGFEFVSCALQLRATLASADLCITAEGVFDESSMRGKLVGELATLCRELDVPCVVLAGRASAQAPAGLTVVELGGGIAQAREALTRAARVIATR